MVIPFVVPEILGGVEAPPQMPLSCQKRQMPLTVKKKKKHQKNTKPHINTPKQTKITKTHIDPNKNTIKHLNQPKPDKNAQNTPKNTHKHQKTQKHLKNT